MELIFKEEFYEKKYFTTNKMNKNKCLEMFIVKERI